MPNVICPCCHHKLYVSPSCDVVEPVPPLVMPDDEFEPNVVVGTPATLREILPVTVDEIRRRARAHGADVDRLNYVQYGHGFGELPYEEEE